MINDNDVKENIRITFLGDFLLGGEYLKYIQRKNLKIDYAFNSIANIFNQSDIIVLNLEGPISDRVSQKREDTYVHLVNNPYILQLLENKLVIYNLANNHIMDYNVAALRDTIDNIKSNNQYYVGAGYNIKEADIPLIIKYKNKNIAFLSYTDDAKHIGSVIATSDKAGVSSYKDSTIIYNSINELSNKYDYVVVMMHWGYEFYEYPSPEQINLARCLIRSGANLIIGHHPHILQGYEDINGNRIYYSIGNFFLPPQRMDNGRINNKYKDTNIFNILNVELCDKHIIYKEIIYGRLSKKYKLVLFDKKENIKRNNYFNKISNNILLDNYNNFWYKYVIRRNKWINYQEILCVFKKLFSNYKGIMHISLEDIKRNISRIASIFKLSRN